MAVPCVSISLSSSGTRRQMGIGPTVRLKKEMCWVFRGVKLLGLGPRHGQGQGDMVRGAFRP